MMPALLTSLPFLALCTVPLIGMVMEFFSYTRPHVMAVGFNEIMLVGVVAALPDSMMATLHVQPLAVAAGVVLLGELLRLVLISRGWRSNGA